MKLFVLAITIIYFTLINNKQIYSKNNEDMKILKISVNGLVCDFCARSIEKIFNKRESVERINVNLEEMLITIYLQDGEFLDDDIIKKLIKDSGYDVREIKRGK